MSTDEKVNILLVDDQPGKLMTYEAILGDLGENLIKATSGRKALERLLKTEVAVVLIDVCMPELDGFELAAMIREHPRFQQTAIIFVSAVHLTHIDYLRGYQSGAVDYVPVPVVPEVLRAKVKIFAELFRKTRQLERLNAQLEQRVSDRTAALEASIEQLRQSEQRRSLALAAGRMGSWEWDPSSDEYFWDEGQYRIFGVAPEDTKTTGEDVWGFLHPDDRNFVQDLTRRAANAGSPFDGEFRIIRPNGEVRWCVSGGAPSLDRDGRAVRFSGVTYDITERKQAEKMLHQANEELERRIEERTIEREHALAQLFEAQKLDTIGQLTGGVAHDFNNLLMVVLGSLELLKKRLPDHDARAARLLENAVQGAERGAALTQRLLAFARRQDLKPQAIDIAELVGGMEDLLKRAVGPGVHITTSLPHDVAPVRIDANQFELVLLNLAVNARDAMPGGGSLTISAENETIASGGASNELIPGDYVRVAVSDTGIGMDEATMAKATEPFFTTKGPGKGTGLGLSMIQGLTAQSGGRLKISSLEGEGTTVELWLPRAQSQPIKRPKAIGRQPDQIPQPCTVLVVDDDALVRTGAVAMLEDLGHNVIEVSSAAKALAILNSPHAVDVVVTDHAMPGMTGMELVRRLRCVQPSLVIILATGYAELPDGEAEDPSLPRLSKPFRQQELADAISDAIERRADGLRTQALADR